MYKLLYSFLDLFPDSLSWEPADYLFLTSKQAFDKEGSTMFHCISTRTTKIAQNECKLQEWLTCTQF